MWFLSVNNTNAFWCHEIAQPHLLLRPTVPSAQRWAQVHLLIRRHGCWVWKWHLHQPENSNNTCAFAGLKIGIVETLVKRAHLGTKSGSIFSLQDTDSVKYKNKRLEQQCSASCFLCEGADRDRPVLPFTQQPFVGRTQTHGSNYNRPASPNPWIGPPLRLTWTYFIKDPILPGDSTWQKRLINWLFGKWPANVTAKKDS